MERWRRALSWALRHDSLVSDVGKSFLALERRGTEILMVFDANEGGIDLMEEHLRPKASLMRKSKTFRLEIIRDADHTFTPLWAQAHLCETVGEHWQNRFSSEF
jgi:hypothetical protein